MNNHFFFFLSRGSFFRAKKNGSDGLSWPLHQFLKRYNMPTIINGHKICGQSSLYFARWNERGGESPGCQMGHHQQYVEKMLFFFPCCCCCCWGSPRHHTSSKCNSFGNEALSPLSHKLTADKVKKKKNEKKKKLAGEKRRHLMDWKKDAQEKRKTF